MRRREGAWTSTVGCMTKAAAFIAGLFIVAQTGGAPASAQDAAAVEEARSAIDACLGPQSPLPLDAAI